MDEQIKKSWERFLNPDIVKENLIFASLYITAFETLKDSIVKRIKDFFITGIEDTDFIYSDEYKHEVLSLGKNPLESSLIWLKDNGVINQNDINSFRKIKSYRNKLAHEMMDFLTTHEESNEIELFIKMNELLSKIEKWWIINVEIIINPDYDSETINEDDVTSGVCLSLQMLLEIALGNKKESTKYYEEFVNKKY